MLQRLSNTKTAQKQVLTSLGGSPSDDWSTYAECLTNTLNEPNIKEASGEGVASWDNGVRCVLPEVQIGGKAEQVTYTGKNLLNLAGRTNIVPQTGEESTTIRQFTGANFYIGVSVNNVASPTALKNYTIDVVNGVFSVEANSGGHGIGIDFRVEPGQTYTVSATCGDNAQMRVGFFDGAGSFLRYKTLNGGGTFTVQSDSEWAWIVLRQVDLAGVPAVFSNIQLELGTTATSYEPYTGGVPVPNPNWPTMPEFSSGTEVVSRGKNLFDVSTLRDSGYVTVTGDEFVFDNVSGIPKTPISAKHGRQYYLSCKVKVATNQRIILVVHYDDGSSESISTFNGIVGEFIDFGGITTANKTVVAIGFAGAGGIALGTTFKQLQIEEGTAATPYEPFFDGGTAVAPELLAIPGTEYMDTWDAQTGKGVRRVGKLVLDGTETWGVMNGTYPIFYIRDLPAPLWDNSISLRLQGRFSHGSYTDGSVEAPGSIAFVYQVGIARIRGPENITTVEDWKQWLAAQYAAGTPVTIWYALKEPIQFQTAPQPLIAPKGTGHIMQVGGNLDGCPITAKYIDASNLQETVTITAGPAGVSVRPSDGYPAIVDAIITAEPNFQPWNIAAGIEIWGKIGTARPAASTDWPDVPATEEEMDEAVVADDPDAPVEDKFVLLDNEGNITTGYLYAPEISGLMDYGGYLVLPDKPEHDQDAYPYEMILLKDDVYTFVCSASAFKRGLFSVTSNGPYISFSADPDTGEYWAPAESGESFSKSGTIKWTNAEITGTSTTAVPDPYEPVSAGFALTGYRFETTEFEAIGWRRISKHTTGADAGKVTKDNFVRKASTGWNYLKHLRSCVREKLYYRGQEVWPSKPVFAGSVTVPSPDSLNGGMKILITYEGDDYTYQLKAGDRVRLTVDGAIFEYTVGASSTNSDGDYIRTFGNYWLCVEVGSTHVSDDGGNFAIQEDGTWLVLYARNQGTYNIRIEKVVN